MVLLLGSNPALGADEPTPQKLRVEACGVVRLAYVAASLCLLSIRKTRPALLRAG